MRNAFTIYAVGGISVAAILLTPEAWEVPILAVAAAVLLGIATKALR